MGWRAGELVGWALEPIELEQLAERWAAPWEMAAATFLVLATGALPWRKRAR